MTKAKTSRSVKRPNPLAENSTKDELEVYFNNYERYLDSLFSFDDLCEVLEKEGRASLPDNFHSRKIARQIATMKDLGGKTIFDCMTDEGETLTKQIKVEREAWEAVKTCIQKRIEATEAQILWFQGHPNYGPENIEGRNIHIARLAELQDSMSGIEAELFIGEIKKRGQHGGAAIKNPMDVVNLYCDLKAIYKESKQKTSKEEIYRLIKLFLAAAEISVILETIKTIIKQNLKLHKELCSQCNHISAT